MSLDFYLMADTGAPEESREDIFDVNYTHNVIPMWKLAGVFDALYNSKGKLAGELVDTLAQGVAAMETNPAAYIALNPSNGWGSYETALPFLKNILRMCRLHPKAIVDISK